MRPLVYLLIILALLGLRHTALAQSPGPNDDDFNAGLLVGAVIFLSVAAGAMLVGVLASALVLLFIFGMVTAGVFSTAIMVGLYKRSVSAGFRILLVIVCAIGGIIAGLTGLYLVNRLFHLHLSHSIIAWTGLIGGLAGGILLGLCLFGIIRLFLDYTRKNLSIPEARG